MNYEISELERMAIKCAQLEFVLAQERAQATVRAAMEARDALVKSSFETHVGGTAKLDDYSFDLEKGVFVSQVQAAEVELVDDDN